MDELTLKSKVADSDIGDLGRNIQKVEENIEEVKRAIAVANTGIRNVEKDIEEVKRVIRVVDTVIISFHEHSDKEMRISYLKDNLTDKTFWRFIDKDIAELEDTLTRLEGKQSTYEGDMREDKRRLDKLQDRLEEDKRRLDTLQNELRERQQQGYTSVVLFCFVDVHMNFYFTFCYYLIFFCVVFLI